MQSLYIIHILLNWIQTTMTTHLEKIYINLYNPIEHPVLFFIISITWLKTQLIWKRIIANSWYNSEILFMCLQKAKAFPFKNIPGEVVFTRKLFRYLNRNQNRGKKITNEGWVWKFFQIRCRKLCFQNCIYFSLFSHFNCFSLKA